MNSKTKGAECEYFAIHLVGNFGGHLLLDADSLDKFFEEQIDFAQNLHTMIHFLVRLKQIERSQTRFKFFRQYVIDRFRLGKRDGRRDPVISKSFISVLSISVLGCTVAIARSGQRTISRVHLVKPSFR